jgi:hypothetical protein
MRMKSPDPRCRNPDRQSRFVASLEMDTRSKKTIMTAKRTRIRSPDPRCLNPERESRLAASLNEKTRTNREQSTGAKKT